jgi:hypothetical protein
MSATPPYVAYATATTARVPAARWPDVYASLQALKGHVQEYPGCQRFDAFADVAEDGVRVDLYTTWDNPDQLDVFLDRGYTFERMLADLGLDRIDRSERMEKIF